MFSRFHRRTPSNPTSPADPSHSWGESSAQLLDHAHPPRSQDGNPQDPLFATAPPSFLPQITRAPSAGYEVSTENSGEGARTKANERDSRLQYWDPALNGNARARDIHTFSNHQRTPYAGTQRPESAGNAMPTKYASPQYTRTSLGMNQEAFARPNPPEPSHSFVTAADLQNKSIATGRRPTGARLPTPPPTSEKSVSTFEPVQSRPGKARLNLLNPMSLLARRRTSQAVPQLSPETLVSSRTGNKFSENFDPRIRGTVVHDFSAPRPKRNVSYNDVRTEDVTNSRQYPRSPNLQYGDSATDESVTSPWSGGNHTPVFTENFEEEQYPAAGPHVRRASDLTDLPLPKPPYAQGAQKQLESNSTIKSNDLAQKQIEAARKISARKPVSDVGPPVPPKVEGEVPNPLRRISIDPSSTPPKSRPSSKKAPSRNVSGVSAKDAAVIGLPKHMKSTSSRFSFDMIGAAEQERLLEDRHRQRALEKKNTDGDEQYDDEMEDEYDFDNMDDDDGLEERIPGVNADLDEEDLDGLEEEIPSVKADVDEEDLDGVLDDSENVAGFTFQQSSLASPLSPTTPGMVSTPRDANGDVIGFAMTKNSPYISTNLTQSTTSPTLSTAPEVLSHAKDLGFQGLGLQGVDMGLAKDSQVEKSPKAGVNATEFPQPSTIEDDDLYFDDGIIADFGDGDDPVEFDESVFDNVDTDEYGRPLKTFSSLPTLYSPPNLTADPSPSLNKIFEADKTNATLAEIKEDAISLGTIPPDGALAPQPSIARNLNSEPATHGLTQDTLAAYQSALAAAAHAAVANGKFRRDSTPPHPTSEQEDAHPGLITDSSHTSHYEPFSPSYELEDDFDYDDALEDDAIIAAANAEALANDCDGFYGQEFGFYSVPSGEAEYSNGGYFGPRGIEGVNRSQSGRIASREPNLTPITERSEYSNRNSFMSLSMHGPGSVTSPGLAQLAGLMSSADFEGDMSLNALLKLRRGAWGGSQASLHSSNGSPRSAGADESSPVGQLPPWSQAGNSWSGLGQNGGGGHRRKNSNFSVVSEAASEIEEEEEEIGMSEPGSPTLTMGNSFVDTSQKNTGQKGKGEEDKDKHVRKHRYTGSAESISYRKEDDPVSGERWILERRRTAESGEVELLGREVVSGGRI